MNCLDKYFDLTTEQRKKFALFKEIFLEWNEKINLISRKDTENLCLKHVLHSLALAKYNNFKNSKVLDVGTGGGFPGIPLAIMFPQANFLLIDSIGKKINAVNDIIEKLDLKNATAKQIRSEQLKGKFDYIVARAVTKFPVFVRNVKHLKRRGQAGKVENGILYLKGGDVEEEIKPFLNKIILLELDFFFDEEFFQTKNIIHYIF